jgi:hypothetical protein
MDVFRKGIAAADGVIRRTGQNDQPPGPAAGAFRGRATPGGRGQAGSPGMSTPQRTAGASSLMDADVVFHTPSTSAPAASGGSMDLSALAEMLRIDITARCGVVRAGRRGRHLESSPSHKGPLPRPCSLRDELQAELAVARTEAASAGERAARAEAAVAELAARGSGGALPAQSSGDGDGRTEWHDKVERALQVLMDRVMDAATRAQAAEQAAAQALALAESGVARPPPPAGSEQQVQLPAGGPYASEEMVFSALAGMQSSVESAHAIATQALAMTDALRASQAAPPPPAPAAVPAEAALRQEDAVRLAALEEAIAGMAPRDKVAAALKKLNGDITAASDAAADAARRIEALESAAAASGAQVSASASADAAATSAQLAAVSQVQASLAAVQEELAASAASLAAVRGDVESLRLRQQQQMVASPAAAPAAEQAATEAAGQAQAEGDDRLDELSVGSAPEAAFVADAGALEEGPSPELATAVAVSDVQASLSALESRVEQLASDWGLGIIATQAATADAPVNARTLAELNASVLVMEARLEEIATDWGMASLMSAQSSQSLEKRLADVETALRNAPDVASALGIITPRVKQLEASVTALKAAAAEAAQAAGEAGAVASTALALARDASSVAARAQPAGEQAGGLTHDDLASAVQAAVEPLGEEITRLQGVVSSATATVSSCCNDLARCMDAVERATQQVEAVEVAEREARESVLAHVKETETSVWQSVVLMRDAVNAAASPAPHEGRSVQGTPPPRTPVLTHASPSATSGRSPQRGWLGARTPEPARR